LAPYTLIEPINKQGEDTGRRIKREKKNRLYVNIVNNI
jgi:hypothetical protein